MRGSWDAIREVLGHEYELGSWFCISESEVFKQNGEYFANKGGLRPVVLANFTKPAAVLFPRSTSGGSGFSHAAHAHTQEEAPCQLNQDGWVVLGALVTVDSAQLNEDTFSCIEPQETGLCEQIKEALKI
jgi:hypothetical protein